MSATLPKPSEFRHRTQLVYNGICLCSAALLGACLFALLDLTSDAWRWLWSFAAGYAAVATAIAAKRQLSDVEPIGVCLNAAPDDVLADEECRSGLAAALDLPRRSMQLAAGTWWATGCLTAASMAIRFEAFGIHEIASVVVAGWVAGFAAGCIAFFAIKRQLAPVSAALAFRIPDPEACRPQVKRVPLRRKIVWGAIGVLGVQTAFSALFFSARIDDGVRDFAIRWQGRVLDELVERLDEQELGDVTASLLGDELIFAARLDIAILDFSESGVAGRGRLEAPIVTEIRAEYESGADGGAQTSRFLKRVSSWRAIGDDSVLVVSTPLSDLATESRRGWIALATLLAIALATGGVLAWLVSSDIVAGLGRIRADVERLASGDLRRGDEFDSEDEIGEISRALASTVESLRSGLARIFGAVEQFEKAASGIASISEGVAAVTSDQASGIQQAALSTEAIDNQVRGIAESSAILNSSVEETSSSILELSSASDELNETAGTLSETIAEVSSSMEQIVRSVSQVVESTKALSEASSETSSSMELMASSLVEVDESAEESARLSNYVVSTAESGQEKVRQTIEGMHAIRLATETAESVIRSLGGRTKEIGAIVDVIDDVADETNLLALNAAIIAAQAGEHGRAFSVVADEIKDLAERVLASTKEIAGLIRAVQEEADNAIGAIETGTESVASGVDLSAEAGVSLEEITSASRDSGGRIQGILKAVRAQARAASHVVELMEKVRRGVEEIRRAATEQERGNTLIYRSTTAIRDVAKQVRGTTEEQSRGSGRIRESVEGQRDAVEQINRALQEQAAACRSAVEFIEEIFAQTRANEESARRMDRATKGLLKQSAELRKDVHRFRI